MGSRLKQKPEQTFYWFFEAACPVARDKEPGVLFQYPEDFNDEESSQTLPRFCFPFDVQGASYLVASEVSLINSLIFIRVRDSVPVQHFTFVLTDLEGCQRFGFCRLTHSTQTCLCILSYLPWFEVFYKLLNNLADYATNGQTTQMKALLAALYKQPIPLAAGSVSLQMGEQLLVDTEVSHPVGHPGGQEGVPYFIAPDPRSLPSIPENRNLTELIVAVDVGNLLQLYASMLFERRILIFASKLSTLTACVHAVSAVLYPMYWQHIFIPVLPPHLLDYCCAPMPYLIGVHTSLSERVRSRGLEEVVILNVDTNTLETPFDDLKRIPSDVMTGLKACLKRQAVSPGCGVSRAFLKAQALLFGSYRDALQGPKEDGMRFSEELFLDHKSSSMRRFLQSAVHLQFFKQFIDCRLDILNKGKEPDDLFEEECETAAGRRNSYQQFVGNLKTGGGALILNMKSKANVKAKGLAKSGLKNLLMHRAHKEQNSLQRGGSVSHRRVQSDCLQSRLPITQHFGMPRPRRPVHKHRTPSDDMNDSGDSWNGALSGPLLESEFELQKEEEEGNDSMLCDPEEMDLLGEIFDTLSSRSSHDRGVLYGTRSLDLFGPDSHDYITKHGFPANPSQESLHSWNLDTPEELSDLIEDSDQLRVATRVTEDEGMESQLAAWELGGQEHGQTAAIEKLEVKVAKDGNQEKDDINNIKEVKADEERQTVGQEERVNFREEPVTEMTEKPEEIKLKEMREEEQNQSMEVSEEQETEKGTNERLKDETRGEDQEKETEGTGYLQTLTKLVPLPSNTVEEPVTEMTEKPEEIKLKEMREEEQNQSMEVSEEQETEKGTNERLKDETRGEDQEKETEGTGYLQRLVPLPSNTVDEQEQNLTLTASPRSLGHADDSKSPTAEENRHEEAVETVEQEMKQTPSPDTVMSAVALFQSRAKELAEPRKPYNVLHSRQRVPTRPPGDPDTSEKKSWSEGYKEEDLPPIKVSDLKKRFEA